MKVLTTPKSLSILLLSAMFAVAAPAFSQRAEEPLLKLLNDMADKPQNHLAIATYYRTLAAEARVEVEKHKAMNTRYHNHAEFKSGALTGRAMSRHCDRLIELQTATANEYEELAKLHETEAATR